MGRRGRTGSCGDNASWTSMSSSSARNGSSGRQGGAGGGPAAAMGASTDLSEELIELAFAIEQSKVLAHLGHVERFAIRTKQRTYVFEVLRARRIVHDGLELEGDQAFAGHDAELPERA